MFLERTERIQQFEIVLLEIDVQPMGKQITLKLMNGLNKGYYNCGWIVV